MENFSQLLDAKYGEKGTQNREDFHANAHKEYIAALSEEDFEKISNRIEELLQIGFDNLSVEQEKELDNLSTIAEEYEAIHYPMPLGK